MATQKPISTICYNTESFLKEKLEELYKAHVIQAYQYICHKGEDGDKDHIHLRLEPNKKLDPMDLTTELTEYEKGKEKPLVCRPWRPAKEEDWILYAVHDKEYLRLKYGGGEKGEKLPYRWQDIKVSYGYDMEIGFIRAKSKLEHTSSNMIKRIASGEATALDLAYEGENIYTLNAVIRALNMTDYEMVNREFQILKAKILKLELALKERKLWYDIQPDNSIKIRDLKEGEEYETASICDKG